MQQNSRLVVVAHIAIICVSMILAPTQLRRDMNGTGSKTITADSAMAAALMTRRKSRGFPMPIVLQRLAPQHWAPKPPAQVYRRSAVLAGFAIVLAGMPGTLLAQQPAPGVSINTGGETGAYHSAFCPVLAARMKEGGVNARCVPSRGTRENLERVLADPGQFGYGQLDVFALESSLLSARNSFQILRQDDARECLFAVTRNRSITSFGALSMFAKNMAVFLPPKESGSAGTYQFLSTVDDDGLGRAKAVAYATSVDEAIKQALANDDGVAFFVQFPDASNERFQAIKRLGGHLVPVIDRDILRQEVAGRQVYFAEETEIDNPSFVSDGGKLTTACTPLVVFSGTSDRLANDDARRAHDATATAVKLMRHENLTPREPNLQRIARRSRELSSAALDRLTRTSELARARAKPFLDWVIERAAPRI